MRIFLLLLLLISIPAQAGIFIEPEAGYEYGKDPSTVSGLSYGAQAGLRKHIFFIGGEYEVSNLTGDLTAKDLSVIAGLSFLHYRIWGGYIASAKINGDSGTGYKVGIGTRFFRVLRLDAEYVIRNYNNDGSLKSYKLMLGIPLNF